MLPCCRAAVLLCCRAAVLPCCYSTALGNAITAAAKLLSWLPKATQHKYAGTTPDGHAWLPHVRHYAFCLQAAAQQQQLAELSAERSALQQQLDSLQQQHGAAEAAWPELQQQLQQCSQQELQGAEASRMQQDWAQRAQQMVQEALQQRQVEHPAHLESVKGMLAQEHAGALAKAARKAAEQLAVSTAS